MCLEAKVMLPEDAKTNTAMSDKTSQALTFKNPFIEI